jgi:hypothetical protein
MCQWFTNHSKAQQGGTAATAQVAVLSKPYATNAILLFAKDK